MAPVCLRDMTAAEHAVVQKLAHSRTAPAQRVQRAQIIWRASRGESASAIAARVGLDGETVRKRIRRFNAEGLEALKDRHRSGRRPTYTPEQTATVIATALTKPQTLGVPFASWTLDRLAATGVRFTHCFVQPLCTPTRVQLMTGKYNVRNYVNFGQMDPEAVTFGNLFKEAGYATCMVGKWQLGTEPDLPQRLGFDEGMACV
jgi:transposase